MLMNELRLLDPDGYTVPGTVHTGFPAEMEGELRAHLRTVAEREAAQWADFGHRAEDYRIEPAEPITADRGTFLDLLATPIAA